MSLMKGFFGGVDWGNWDTNPDFAFMDRLLNDPRGGGLKDNTKFAGFEYSSTNAAKLSPSEKGIPEGLARAGYATAMEVGSGAIFKRGWQATVDAKNIAFKPIQFGSAIGKKLIPSFAAKFMKGLLAWFLGLATFGRVKVQFSGIQR